LPSGRVGIVGKSDWNAWPDCRWCGLISSFLTFGQQFPTVGQAWSRPEKGKPAIRKLSGKADRCGRETGEQYWHPSFRGLRNGQRSGAWWSIQFPAPAQQSGDGLDSASQATEWIAPGLAMQTFD
jgi:hypothetical protein